METNVMMEINELKTKVKKALTKFYNQDFFLIQSKLCERCLVHRIAIYLEEQGFQGYFVDCEYNKAHLNRTTTTKRVSNPKGNYIDIVITRRDGNYRNDLVCFEIKKSYNYQGRKKDRQNLKILTGGIRFGYDYGFYILLGETIKKTKIEIYQSGEKTQDFNLGNEDRTQTMYKPEPA